MQQLPLTLRWPAQQRFDSFIAGDNAAAVALLRDTAANASGDWIFLSGAPGCGKTHLLIAVCAAASASDCAAQYLSLRGAQPAGIRALGGSDLLALDDVDAIAGNAEAEHALFDLYNRCKVEKSTLLFGADKPPAHLGINLPDLVSRLASCTQVILKPLNEDERREAVRQRAQTRGLILDDAVLDWLFARTQRDLGSLAALIERLDRESLAAKRRITLPFLRTLLEGEKKNG
jgi:DnaA-homolog protein